MDDTSEDSTVPHMNCLLCYKPYTVPSSRSVKNVTINFFKVLEKKSNGKIVLPYSLFKEPRSKLEKVVAGAVHSVCTDCAIVVEKYNALYSELECLQLKLRWQVLQLHRIMKASGRVSSRVREYEENIGSQLMSKGDHDDGMGVVDLIRGLINAFRAKIFKTFDGTLKEKVPQVLIRRLHHRDPFLTKAKKASEHDLGSDSLVESFLYEVSHGDPTSKNNTSDEEGLISVNVVSIQDLKSENGNGDNRDGGGNEVDLNHGASLSTTVKTEVPGLHSSFNEDVPDNDFNYSHEEMELGSPLPLSSPSPEDDEGNLNLQKKEDADMTLTSSDRVRKPKIAKRGGNKIGKHCRGKKSRFSRNVEKVDRRNADSIKETAAAHIANETEDTDLPIASSSSENSQGQGRDKAKAPASSDNEDDGSGSEAKQSTNRTTKAADYRAMKRSFPCNFKTCRTRCTTEAKLEAHFLTHGNFPCNFCNFSGDQVRKLVDHELKTHATLSKKKDWIQCSRCPMKFTAFARNSDNVITHFERSISEHYMTKHLNIPKVVRIKNKCQICGREVELSRRTAEIMAFHMKKYHDIEGKEEDSIFRCQKCSAPFLTEYQRQRHVWKEHGLRFSCLKCDLAFPDGLKYRRHMTKHSMKGQFQCSIPGCGQTFHSQNSLNFHNAAHKGNSKLLACPKSGCRRTFMNDHRVRVHLNSRDHKKPKKTQMWTCDRCGKSLAFGPKACLKSRIESHMRGHDGPSAWEFSCEICGKMCQTTFKLEEHLRTHSREKPFACEYCGRSFSIQFNLKRHIKLVHNVQLPLERQKRSPVVDNSDNDEDEHSGSD